MPPDREVVSCDCNGSSNSSTWVSRAYPDLAVMAGRGAEARTELVYEQRNFFLGGERRGCWTQRKLPFMFKASTHVEG